MFGEKKKKTRLEKKKRLCVCGYIANDNFKRNPRLKEARCLHWDNNSFRA